MDWTDLNTLRQHNFWDPIQVNHLPRTRLAPPVFTQYYPEDAHPRSPSAGRPIYLLKIYRPRVLIGVAFNERSLQFNQINVFQSSLLVTRRKQLLSTCGRLFLAHLA